VGLVHPVHDGGPGRPYHWTECPPNIPSLATQCHVPPGCGHDGYLTTEERQADLTLDQLKQLVGLVEYDEERDPFPVTGWDAVVFVVGKRHPDRPLLTVAYGMELVGYSGPETGNRDHKRSC